MFTLESEIVAPKYINFQIAYRKRKFLFESALPPLINLLNCTVVHNNYVAQFIYSSLSPTPQCVLKYWGPG